MTKVIFSIDVWYTWWTAEDDEAFGFERDLGWRYTFATKAEQEAKMAELQADKDVRAYRPYIEYETITEPTKRFCRFKDGWDLVGPNINYGLRGAR